MEIARICSSEFRPLMPFYAADGCERGEIIVYDQEVIASFTPHWL
jgi:hypothetical protein